MKIRTSPSISVWLILLVGDLTSHATEVDEECRVVQIRRPVALAVVNDGRQLVTANQRSGTISLLDLHDQKVVRETSVGKRLSDIIITNDVQRLLVTDEEAHELIVIRLSPTDCRVEQRIAVSPFPVRVRINDDGTRAYVASLWSKTITVVDLPTRLADDGDSRTSTRQIRLSFAPRELLVVDVRDQQRLMPQFGQPQLRLVVADAFGSKLAMIDPDSGEVSSVREIPAHAIRGMRLHPTKPRLLVSHQMLSRLAHTTFDDVHWGSLLANCLRSLDLSDILDPKADLLKKSNLEYLGGPERGAGDPAGFVFQSDGSVAIALSGTDEFVVDDGNRLFTRRLKTEHYPTAVAISPDGAHAFVVNTLSDSVTVVKLEAASVITTISLGPRPELTSADRGERLFHSAKLSHDNWFSCASCHVDGHTNGLLNDNLTDGSFGTAKRVLSLRGVADTAPYAWNGRFHNLAEQIGHSVQSTMQGAPLSESQTSDLEAYLRSLPPPPAVGSEEKLAVDRGAALFEKLDCRSCHMQPTFTSSRIVDVTLKDERDTSNFNPPSLRGVNQNGPYFHDGRATSLESVFTQFRHQLERDLSSDELHDLIAFLTNL